MGELLNGLYDDLLEPDNVSERPAVPVAPTRETYQEAAPERQTAAPPRVDTPTQGARPQWTAPPTAPNYLPVKPTGEVAPVPTNEKVKYFIMKSNNSTNIDRSLASGVWSTQHHNEAKLNNAFVDGFEVRLVFSINQSGHFQGYAVMKSAIGRGPKHNIWVGSAWGGFFEVEWQLQYDFPFSRFEHLSNPLNEGKPVKFARDGQEIPADVGNEVVRIMQEIARASGISKPVIPNQLRVEPYPANSFSEGRSGSMDRRDYYAQRGRGSGRGRGHGYRWGDGYGRYGDSYNHYPYPSSAPYPYASRWSGQSYYNEPYGADYGRQDYPPWGHMAGDGSNYVPSPGQKRPRSPSLVYEEGGKRSLYDMTYEEYLDCYDRVQRRIQEIIHTGELWKALGMIPESYEWTEEDQRRITESGWFSAWFGGLLGESGTQKSDPVVEDAESSTGSRVMTDAEFVEFCRKFCGEDMQFNEEKIRAYYEEMSRAKELGIGTRGKPRCA